jgi:hypothetical protein
VAGDPGAERAELVERILTDPDPAVARFTGRSYLLTGSCGAAAAA